MYIVASREIIILNAMYQMLVFFLPPRQLMVNMIEYEDINVSVCSSNHAEGKQ